MKARLGKLLAFLALLATPFLFAEVRPNYNAGSTFIGGLVTAVTTFGTAVDAANSVNLVSSTCVGGVEFEGVTVNGFETCVTATDPTGDNAIAFPDGSGTLALAGSVPSTLTTIEAVTVTKTTTFGEAGETYTNTGDLDGATITLENDPTAGGFWNFAVTASQILTIQPSAGEVLKFGSNSCTTLTSNIPGSTVTIKASAGGAAAVFMSQAAMGVWTCN